MLRFEAIIPSLFHDEWSISSIHLLYYISFRGGKRHSFPFTAQAIEQIRWFILKQIILSSCFQLHIWVFKDWRWLFSIKITTSHSCCTAATFLSSSCCALAFDAIAQRKWLILQKITYLLCFQMNIWVFEDLCWLF